MQRFGLARLRLSAWALAAAVLGWAAGCGTVRPAVDPGFAERRYTPARIALLPPDIFAIYDQYGENDPEKSAALGRAATEQAVRLIAQALEQRGYDVDLAAGRDGVRSADGQVLVSGEELGWLANSVLRYANSQAGEGQGTIATPSFIAPELAARVGWATQSDALLYVNVKGVAQSSGKRTAQVVGAVFFVAVIVAIVVLILLESRGGGRSSSSGPSTLAGGGGSRAVRAAPTPAGATSAVSVPRGATRAAVAPRGHGAVPRGGGGRVYGGPHIGLGIGVVVPLEGPAHTHEGSVVDEDEPFAGDHLYASLTLFSAHDGRVLWHLRDDFDVALDDPRQIERFVHKTLDTLPVSLRPASAPAPSTTGRAAPVSPTPPSGP